MKGALLSLLAIPRAILYQRIYRHIPPNWQERLLQRLQRFTRHASERSSFYRHLWNEAGVDPRAIHSLEDFQRLPIVSRETWRALPQDELNPNPVVVFRRATGGTSSGTPVEIPFTLRDELQLRTMVYAGRYYQGGHWYDRPLSLAHPDPRFVLPRSSITVGRRVVAPPNSREHVDALAQNTSGVVTAYSMLLWHTVMRAHREGIALPEHRVVLLGGEVLPDTIRRTISEALQAPGLQIFGATDYGRMAIDCHHFHLHISPEATHLEIIVDGRPAHPGEVGEIVITNFGSHARPLVRVRTGDYGAWGAGQCPCGNLLPYLKHITGRQTDRIRLPDQSYVYWPDIEKALEPVQDDVLGYQAEQMGPDRVLIRLTLNTETEVASAHVDCLRALFKGMSVEVERTDLLKSEPNGKTRVVIGQTAVLG